MIRSNMETQKDPFGVLGKILEMEQEENDECFTISIIDPNNVLTSTIMTTNIAISLAKQGHEVLLIDLNMIQPSLSFLGIDTLESEISTNDFYTGSVTFDELLSKSYYKSFETGGGVTICNSSFDIKKRIIVRNLRNKDLTSTLTKFMTNLNIAKSKYRYIFINMPSISEFNILIHGTLLADYNFLLIDHNEVSLALGFDLVTNITQIHPLIEFHGIMIHKFDFAPNSNDEEKNIIESSFQLPIVAVLPEIPGYNHISKLELIEENSDFRLNKYFKILSQDLFNFLSNPTQLEADYFDIEVLVIANIAGIPLFNAYLKDGEIIPEYEVLTSAALTAVVTGVTAVLKEISKANDETKLIKQKKLSLLVEHKPPLRAMLLTGKDEGVVRNKLQFFIESFANRFKDEIKEFVGNIAPFSNALALVEEIFE